MHLKKTCKSHGIKFSLPRKEVWVLRVEDWDKVVTMKHIWNLFTQGGSLWVASVHEILLKGRSFWVEKTPQDCTWGWRNVLKLRAESKNFISHEVGDGKNFFLWLDNWHPDRVCVKHMVPELSMMLPVLC